MGISDSNRMRIGQVATAAGLGVETVRYYERRGLIPEPARSDAGYRLYPADTVRRLRFIVRAKTLGFTLQEVGELLSLRARPGAGCADVQSQAEAKIEDIDARLVQLEAMKRTLSELVKRCDGQGSTSECPILDALSDDER
jgi:MerR family transcriptional regulator, copper efflux regulator